MKGLALVLLLSLSACATLPVQPARLDGIHDPADGLKRYYEERLTPSPDGYVHRGQAYNAYQLPAFYDAQGAAHCADWARGGRNFRLTGWSVAAAVLAVGAGLSANADANSPARSAWWMSALPAGLLGWTFVGIGDGWFTKPSVALYNKELAEKLGLGLAPLPEEAP